MTAVTSSYTEQRQSSDDIVQVLIELQKQADNKTGHEHV